jgi:ribose transport system ATP-binding protein
MSGEKTPIIEVIGISKQYPGVRALQNITWQVQPGEVHALAGKNGAGKSTLIKILGGSVQPDTGEIRLSGQPVRFGSPHDSIAKGITIINQELMLIPQLSVAENIFLGRLPHNRFGDVNWSLAKEEAKQVMRRLGLEIDPSLPVSSLSVAQQQAVEIARALSRQSDILVMDEPTSALAAREVESLLEIVRRLKSQGKTVIYITHKLNEIFSIADRITVLRDGENIATVNTNEVTSAQVVNLMVGRSMESLFHKKETVVPGAPILEIKHLTRDGIFKDISFTLHTGEILGLAGLVGAGRTEILRAIFGADPIDGGEIYINGKAIPRITPGKMISVGVALAPEDRKQQGLVLGMSILDNFNLASIRHFFRNQKEEIATGENLFSYLNVRAPSLATWVSTLSGGNQQKVVIGKWLATKPQILFLDEPTRGIDISTKADIHLLVQKLAQEGVGIIMVSSELPDLLSVCDRLIVISNGQITGEFHYGDADEETLVAYATGSRLSSPGISTLAKAANNE